MRRKSVPAHRRHGQLSGQGRGDAGSRRGAQGRRRRLVTILAGGTDVWRYDIEIPKQYGVDINIGDTRGVSGIFRFLRTAPVMLGIARDMERLCPDATMLNYTNPMAMLCRVMQRETTIKLTGLCHSVQGTAEMLAALDRRAVSRRSPTPAPASTTWPGT